MAKHVAIIDGNGEVQRRYSPLSSCNQKFSESLLQKSARAEQKGFKHTRQAIPVSILVNSPHSVNSPVR